MNNTGTISPTTMGVIAEIRKVGAMSNAEHREYVKIGNPSRSNNADYDKCPPLGKNSCVKIGKEKE